MKNAIEVRWGRDKLWSRYDWAQPKLQIRVGAGSADLRWESRQKSSADLPVRSALGARWRQRSATWLSQQSGEFSK